MSSIRKAIVLLTATAAVLVCHADPAAAETRIYDHNLCGNACVVNDPSLDYEDSPLQVLNVVATHQPAMVALQEVCFQPFDENVEAQVHALGYHYTHAFGDSTRTVTVDFVSEECGSFGNAVLHVGGFLGSWAPQVSPHHSGDLSKNPPEIRRSICVRFNIYAIVLGCSTHLTNKSDSTAVSQSYSLKGYVSQNWPGKCRWIAGDFNLSPSYNSGTWFISWDGLYNSINTSSNTHDSSGIIDYIWTDDTHTGSFGWINLTNSPASDHKHFRGGIVLTGSCT